MLELLLGRGVDGRTPSTSVQGCIYSVPDRAIAQALPEGSRSRLATRDSHLASLALLWLRFAVGGDAVNPSLGALALRHSLRAFVPERDTQSRSERHSLPANNTPPTATLRQGDKAGACGGVAEKDHCHVAALPNGFRSHLASLVRPLAFCADTASESATWNRAAADHCCVKASAHANNTVRCFNVAQS